MLSFEEKVLALSTLRALGLNRSVAVVSKWKRQPSPNVREVLDKLDSTHYLLDDGFVEKTNTGIVQYVEFAFQQQPMVITKEFYDKCKPLKQKLLDEALSVLHCTHVIGRPHKPTPLHKKVKNVQPEEIS